MRADLMTRLDRDRDAKLLDIARSPFEQLDGLPVKPICVIILIEMGEKRQEPVNRRRWLWYAILLVVPPILVPAICLYFRDRGWLQIDLTLMGLLLAGYWAIVISVGARLLRSQRTSLASSPASPLIELELENDLQTRLSEFASGQQQKMAVAAFDLLDREIPRFELDEDRTRARRDNEHLRQQAGQGAFLVAVTTEILRRLLLLSGVEETDRRLWRTHVNSTASRIVRDALEHQPST